MQIPLFEATNRGLGSVNEGGKQARPRPPLPVLRRRGGVAGQELVPRRIPSLARVSPLFLPSKPRSSQGKTARPITYERVGTLFLRLECPCLSHHPTELRGVSVAVARRTPGESRVGQDFSQVCGIRRDPDGGGKSCTSEVVSRPLSLQPSGYVSRARPRVSTPLTHITDQQGHFVRSR